MSVFERLIEAVRRLPGQGYWLYVAAGVSIVLWMTAVRFVTGVAPPWDLNLGALAPAAYPVYALGVVAYLDDAAARALEAFGPALGGTPAEQEAWRDTLTVLPAGRADLAAGVGLLFGVVVLAATPPTIYGLYAPDLPTTAILVGWVVLFGFSALGFLLYHTWHQLTTVTRIHAAAAAIDPFRPEPLFAFSRLTARTGVAYLVLLYYSLTVNAQLNEKENLLLVADVLAAIAAVACFLLPLVGMHGRLRRMKADLVQSADADIARIGTEVQARARRSDFGGITDLDAAIDSLVHLRAAIDRAPTWPWTPGVLRGFTTAVLLPIAVWVVTRLLATALPF